ncbi:uncharacterized protein J4E78_006575 [Alternaria triticimaculans]|uniref:uncharacterized protein n=1 Tax=Alternaria triticimaculans TaxID=297637 RepID=UPI0020C4A991|nr:uncharacterized protein J4E78_006575 [Alternaria triticimaculans]KAI4656684.1 hypothetical protein J4E78_006575 [Alternaria triticimaculans]
MKLEPQSHPSVISITTQKRKRCAEEQTNPALTVPAKKLKTSTTCAPAITTKAAITTSSKTPGSKSTLVPRGPRKKATLGVKDESLLLMICDSNTTPRKITELHFRKIPHSLIDWHNPHHISQINAWRNQIYGRAGLKARSVSLWYEAEELWFELYFQLSIVEARKRGIMLPGSRQVRDVFNKTFVGRVIKGRGGEDLPPRVEREGNAFASKFNRMFPALRARLNGCVVGRSGDVFVPVITFGMVERYRVLKVNLARMGIEAESEYADGLEEWQWFLSHLPDVGMEAVVEEEEVREMEAKELDAVAALVSLANSPVDSRCD